MNNKELLTKIQSQIPEFYAEQNDGTWIWTYRCLEQQDGSDNLIECFINFTKTILDLDDKEMGLDYDDDLIE